MDAPEVIAFDVFGTCVDWHTGISRQAAPVVEPLGVDPVAFADAWRDRYLPSMARVRSGERGWAGLDTDVAAGLARG